MQATMATTRRRAAQPPRRRPARAGAWPRDAAREVRRDIEEAKAETAAALKEADEISAEIRAGRRKGLPLDEFLAEMASW